MKSVDEFDSPSWGPRGGRIVAEVGEHDASRALMLLDSTGRRIRKLAKSDNAIRPVWSPDGRYIYAVDYELGSAVARWSADGRIRTTLSVIDSVDPQRPLTRAEAKGRFQMISFSPSGRRAALVTRRFRAMVLATVGDSSLTVFATAPRDFAYVSAAVWLDDDRLVFLGKEKPGKGELWELTAADGTVRKRGIDGLSLRDQIALSPDRGTIVITAAVSGERTSWSLWTYSLSAMTKRRLTTGREDIVASWR